MAGNVAGAMYPDDIYGVKYTSGSWNKDPAATIMRSNTDFIYSRQKMQGTVAFLYYDADTNLWTAEIRAANVNEKAVPPENADSEYMKLKEWHTRIGYNFRSDVCESTNGIKVMNQGIYERLGVQNLTYGQPVDKALYKVTSPNSYDLLMTLQIANQRDYYSLTYIYTASYDVADLNVKFAYENYKGEQCVEMYTYPFNGRINIMPWNRPLGKTLLGYSTDPNGGDIYNDKTWFPPVRNDVTYFGIYQTTPCNITLQYYDDVNHKYVDYKTYTIQSGNRIPEEYFKEAEKACVWRKDSEYTLNHWENAKSESKFDTNSQVLGDLTLRMNFDQTITLKLDPADGKFTSDVTEIKVSSKDFFEFIPDNWAEKASDETNDYKLTGWEDQDGNFYSASSRLIVRKDLDLKAVWKGGDLKEYTITFILNGKTIDTVTMHCGDKLAEYGEPDEAAGLLFSGWTWSTKDGLLDKKPETMPACALTATATAEQCYVFYEIEGEFISTPEPTAIGSTVTVREKYTAEGYDVSDWTAEGVTITEGKFTMPAGNVVFTATKTPKKYNVTVYVDGIEIADSPISADYNSTITLPEQPKREGYTFYWETADGTLIPEGKYTIPAKDTEVYGIYTETTYKAYFYMEGEKEPYYVEENLVKGSEVQLIDGPRFEIDGQTFTGWYTTDAVAQYNNTYIIEDKDIRFTGKFVDLNTCAAIIVMQTKDEEGNDIEFDLWQDFGGYGETITLPEVSRDGYMLYYYCSINGAYDRATNTITLPDRDSGNDFVMLYVSYSKLDPDEPLKG